jgi:hypothetical protein
MAAPIEQLAGPRNAVFKPYPKCGRYSDIDHSGAFGTSVGNPS